MADVMMRALWNGQSVTQGIAKTKTELTSLTTVAKSAVSALGIGFGVYQAWAQVQKTFRGVVEEATIFERLQNTINRKGGATAATMAAINTEINRLASSGSALEDTVIANTLERLIETSGDAAGSIDKLGFALDLATAKHIDYDRAAKITGFLMKGQIDQATRFAPEIKELAQNFGDLKGTTELSAKAFEALASVIGAAESDAGTATGNILRFKRGVGELSENLFKVASGGTGFLDFIGKVGDAANRIADAIERGSAHGGVIGGLLGGAVGSAAEAYLRGTAPAIPQPGGAYRGAGARQNIPQMYFQGTQDNPFMMSGTTTTASRKDGESSAGGLTPMEYLRYRNMPGFGMRAGGRARGGERSRMDMPFDDPLKSAVDPTTILDEWIKQREEIASAIADPIAQGIANAARQGKLDLVAMLRDVATGVGTDMLRKGIHAAIFGALTGGFGGGGGGIGSFVLSEPLNAVNDMNIGSVSSSRARARELRMARFG